MLDLTRSYEVDDFVGSNNASTREDWVEITRVYSITSFSIEARVEPLSQAAYEHAHVRTSKM